MKIIKAEKAFLEELVANLFYRLSETACEINGSEEDGWALKVDTDLLSDDRKMIMETAIQARIGAGVFPKELWEVDENLIKNSYSLIANSPEKMEIIQKDILIGAKIPAGNVVVLQQPWAPGMYNTLVNIVLAFNLSDDQMKAVQLSAKAAATGIKIQAITKKSAMVAVATSNVVNRVGRDVAVAGVEIGGTIAAGAVKTGVEMIACATNIAVRDLNPKELTKGPNVQALVGTVKDLWGKHKNQGTDKITSGLAIL